MKYLFILTAFLFSASCLGQTGLSADRLDELADQYARASFQNFYELLSLPNDANNRKDIMKNVEWCESAFQSRNFTTKRLPTATVPLLLAERKVPNPQKTVLIYLQIDGQPVDFSRWDQESPWIPALKEKNDEGEWEAIDWDQIHGGYHPDWRIFARSASDAKGPVAMFLAALDAAKDLDIQPSYNIKVIMDFEEEMGSPRLPGAVERYSSDLAADVLIIFDGPLHITGEPTLKFGARGIATITLTVFGPRVPQHSGHYGNYAPNPAVRLSQLIASMKDDEGKVTISGFYDGITIDPDTRKILAAVPDDEAFIQEKIGIAKPDGVGRNYQEAIQYPSLNVRGMRSAWVGNESRTIVPATATAEIDVRLVKESDPDRLIQLIRHHIEQQGYHLLDREPTDEERRKYSKLAYFDASIFYRAFRTPVNSEAGQWLSSALKRAHGKEPVKIRTSGGSIPISPFVVTLDVPAVMVPTVNMDNNQHSPNENLRIGNYVEGIKTMIAILGESF
jgi:acetylornithine deacetylase/succinyl-diaminopimelate desuccinylase-like protein